MTIDEAVRSAAEIMTEISDAALIDGRDRLAACGWDAPDIRRWLAAEKKQLERGRAQALAELRAKLISDPAPEMERLH